MMRTLGNATDQAFEVYRARRAAGDTPYVAHHYFMRERAVRAVLADLDGDVPVEGPQSTFHGVEEAYDVDDAALVTFTSGPAPWRRHTRSRQPYGTVSIPEGAQVRVFVHRDVLAFGIGDDCYTRDDLAAWERGEWHYVGVEVAALLVDGTSGTAILWGIERGAYWPGSVEGQLWEQVPDLIEQALYEVEHKRRLEASRARIFTVVGYIDNAEQRIVIGVIEGEHQVLAGAGNLDLFAHQVEAVDAESAEASVIEGRDEQVSL